MQKVKEKKIRSQSRFDYMHQKFLPQEEFQRIMATAARDFHEEDIRKGLVGAMMGDDTKKANELQKIAVEESRLGIPLIMGFDVIHGLRTVYPIAIAGLREHTTEIQGFGAICGPKIMANKEMLDKQMDRIKNFEKHINE